MASETTLSGTAIDLLFVGPMILFAAIMILLAWRSGRAHTPERKQESRPGPTGVHHDVAEYEARSRAGVG